MRTISVLEQVLHLAPRGEYDGIEGRDGCERRSHPPDTGIESARQRRSGGAGTGAGPVHLVAQAAG